MSTDKYCVYLRVSTSKQNESHLGIEAQKATCGNYIQSRGGTLVRTFKDVESGTHRNRRGLLEAIDFCKDNGCELVFSHLNRLARDVEFTFKVINTGISVHFCDVPTLNTLVLGVMATVAQYERELISQRTKAALKAKKDRGELTGGACRRTDAESMERARRRSAESRRARARSNPANVAFMEFIEDWEAAHGNITDDTDFTPIADKLNTRGRTTSSGLPFNKNRARAMYLSLKRIYSQN